MNSWAVKTDLFDVATGTIAMEGKRRPGIRDGDNIILFERQSDSEVLFKVFGIARNATSKTIRDGIISFRAELTDKTELAPDRNLSDFTYSLLKVYLYATPGRHFRNRYTSLQSADFNTLVQARIFWARTAFGVFIGQLPEETLEEFVRYVAEVDARALVERSPFNDLWSNLKAFLTGQFIGAHELLDSIAESVEGLEARNVDIRFSEIRLGDDEEGGSVDLLSDQHRKLASFVTSLAPRNSGPGGLFPEIDGRIEENATTESAFEDLFGGTSWPTPKIER